MYELVNRQCIAFEGSTCLASGSLAEVALAVKEAVDRGVAQEILVFDAVDSRPVEIDTRGTAEDVLERLQADVGAQAKAAKGPGRPKLGVVAREVTLLPRHWEWLKAQPGGASVTLRRLVDEARRANGSRDRQRAARDSAYRFLAAVAGNLPGFEEATRALFADDRQAFATRIADWPPDVRDHAATLAHAAFDAAPQADPD